MKTAAILLMAALLGCADPGRNDRSPFTLACRLTARSDGGPDLEVKITLHVDLGKMFFCQDDCAARLPIARADDGQVVFQDNGAFRSEFDRRTGIYTGRSKATGALTTGKCSRL
jgi:hypothetical protein